MKIFLTNLPSFYKINLYNSISKKEKILVFFTGLAPDKKTRNTDFYSGEMNFPFIFLTGSQISIMLSFTKYIISHHFDEIILSLWETWVPWPAVFLVRRSKLSATVESSIFESTTSGLRGFVKKIFFSKLSKCYCSGFPHVRLVRALNFSGEAIVTNGVGIMNHVNQPFFQKRETIRNFIYVGRLIKEKNLEFLIKQFNKHKELHLDIVGFGPLSKSLKLIAGENVSFIGPVDNKELPHYYQKSDVFVLPSCFEPWGLVVEEALNNGLPVFVSNYVGCCENIVNIHNGVVFNITEDDFESKLETITNINNYNEMRKYISKMDFRKKDEEQVRCYLN